MFLDTLYNFVYFLLCFSLDNKVNYNVVKYLILKLRNELSVEVEANQKHSVYSLCGHRII